MPSCPLRAGDDFCRSDPLLTAGHTYSYSPLYMDMQRDPSTGAVGLEDFERVLGWEATRAAEEGQPLCLALLSVQPKATDDETLDDADREAVVRSLVHLLRDHCHPGHVLGRLDDRQFWLLLLDSSPEESLVLIEDLRRLLGHSRVKLPGTERLRTAQVELSAGLACLPRDGSDAATLMSRARSALRAAKGGASGRSRMAGTEKMVLKASYYLRNQLKALADLGRRLNRSEASLLREALDELLDRHSQGK